MIDKNHKTFGIGDTVQFEDRDGRYNMGKVVDAMRMVHIKTPNGVIVRKYANQVELIRLMK